MVCFGANILRVHPNIALLCTNLIPTHLSVDIDNTCPCTRTELSNSTCSVVIGSYKVLHNETGEVSRTEAKEKTAFFCVVVA